MNGQSWLIMISINCCWSTFWTSKVRVSTILYLYERISRCRSINRKIRVLLQRVEVSSYETIFWVLLTLGPSSSSPMSSSIPNRTTRRTMTFPSTWGWSTLLYGRDVIKEDGVCCLGYGGSARAFTDRWVTTRPNFWLPENVTQVYNHDEERVASWINQDHRCWDEDIVRLAVGRSNAKDVLQVVIQVNQQEDGHSRGMGGS